MSISIRTGGKNFPGEIREVKQAEFCLYSADAPSAKLARMEPRELSGWSPVAGSKDEKKVEND